MRKGNKVCGWVGGNKHTLRCLKELAERRLFFNKFSSAPSLGQLSPPSLLFPHFPRPEFKQETLIIRVGSHFHLHAFRIELFNPPPKKKQKQKSSSVFFWGGVVFFPEFFEDFHSLKR